LARFYGRGGRLTAQHGGSRLGQCAQLSAATTAMLEDVVVQTLAVTLGLGRIVALYYRSSTS
jgi:hypothetical protein